MNHNLNIKLEKNNSKKNDNKIFNAILSSKLELLTAIIEHKKCVLMNF